MKLEKRLEVLEKRDVCIMWTCINFLEERCLLGKFSLVTETDFDNFKYDESVSVTAQASLLKVHINETLPLL